jgi:hypothetical protein
MGAVLAMGAVCVLVGLVAAILSGEAAYQRGFKAGKKNAQASAAIWGYGEYSIGHDGDIEFRWKPNSEVREFLKTK